MIVERFIQGVMEKIIIFFIHDAMNFRKSSSYKYCIDIDRINISTSLTEKES